MTSARSSVVQGRSSSALSIETCRRASVHSTIQVLSTAPGAAAFTPALVAPHAMEEPGRSGPAMQAMLTAAPLAAFNAGSAAFAHRNTPSRFASSASARSAR